MTKKNMKEGWVLQRLHQLYEIATTPTEDRQPDLKVALKTLELIGKHHGMFFHNKQTKNENVKFIIENAPTKQIAELKNADQI